MKLAVIGGGLSGLSAAWQAHLEGIDFTLFEAGSTLGGLLQTEAFADDLMMEAGAESCLRSKPELLELCAELGLEDELISTIAENAGAFVVRNGELHPIPAGVRLMAPTALWPFLRSDLISWSGKLRAGLELFLPIKERDAGAREESLSEFVTRRLGAEMLHYLAQPLVAGIYGADPQMLSLEATMPLFQRLEQEHGSVIRGLRAMGTETESQGARYNLFFALKNGFGRVVDALHEKLPKESLRTSARVDSLQSVDGGHQWDVVVRGEKAQRFDSVILALPAPASAELLKDVDEELTSLLSEIVYRGAVTVNLIYDTPSYLEFVPKAYGFVVPAQEKRPLLACTFSSRKWPFRGNKDHALLRTYFGGPNMEWAGNATDEELVAISKSQLDQLLGYGEEPLDFRVHRWPLGLPEYRLGHRQRVHDIKSRLDSFPSLALTGNFFDGVGLPDCVRHGRRTVTQIVQRL